jgi:hypothetical protein
MAYKYFTQKLLSSSTIDLSAVFPEKQEIARESNNVSYSLADIAMYLKDRTENFTKVESQYIDIDSAISQIISKYYISKGEKNPFIVDVDDDALKGFESKTPREAAIVEDGKIKGKGAPKSAPDKKPAAKSETAAPKEEVDGSKIREEFDSVKDVFSLYDSKEQEDLINDYEIEMSALELLDDDEEAQLRFAILRDEFIPELKRLKI